MPMEPQPPQQGGFFVAPGEVGSPPV
jgi:hypothetical protein